MVTTRADGAELDDAARRCDGGVGAPVTRRTAPRRRGSARRAGARAVRLAGLDGGDVAPAAARADRAVPRDPRSTTAATAAPRFPGAVPDGRPRRRRTRAARRARPRAGGVVRAVAGRRWSACTSRSETPERITSLTLCCTSAHFPDPTVWTDRIAAVAAARHGRDRRGRRRALVHPGVGRRRTRTSSVRPRPWSRARRTTGYLACCQALAVWDHRDRLPAITAPTLVIAGAADLGDAGRAARPHDRRRDPGRPAGGPPRRPPGHHRVGRGGHRPADGAPGDVDRKPVIAASAAALSTPSPDSTPLPSSTSSSASRMCSVPT